MPLVTLTCSKQYYLVDDETAVPDPNQQIAIDLANALPELLVSQSDALGIGDVLPDVVQVDLRKFHSRSVNSVNLWVHIWFTEVWDEEYTRELIRDVLIKLITTWFSANDLNVSFALDVFFGSSVGTLVDEKGQVIERW